MNVLALTPGPENSSPGERFRMEQWEPFLRKLGVHIHYSRFMGRELRELLYGRGRYMRKAAGVTSAFFRQLGGVGRARHVDLVYVFREAALIGPAVIETVVAALGRPFVFDFDDATFVPYKSPTNGYWSRLKFPGKTATLCRRARHVMAGNGYLAEYASRFNDGVTVVPTTIDTDLYRPELRRPSPDGMVTIGWTGSHSTAQHLYLLTPALEELARRRPYRLAVVGADAPHVEGAVTESRPWSAATEIENLLDIDIGIMPLPDEPWARGKCGLKALQYMALGTPAVVSPVGVNTEIVRDGENGLVARDGDWVECLLALMESKELRQKLGRRARQTVVDGYSAKRVAPKVHELFTRVAAPVSS